MTEMGDTLHTCKRGKVMTSQVRKSWFLFLVSRICSVVIKGYTSSAPCAFYLGLVPQKNLRQFLRTGNGDTHRKQETRSLRQFLLHHLLTQGLC